MDVTEQNADIYYGRILRIMEVDLSRIYDVEGPRAELMREKELCWMDSATGLITGHQGQVFKNGRREAAFT